MTLCQNILGMKLFFQCCSQLVKPSGSCFEVNAAGLPGRLSVGDVCHDERHRQGTRLRQRVRDLSSSGEDETGCAHILAVEIGEKQIFNLTTNTVVQYSMIKLALNQWCCMYYDTEYLLSASNIQLYTVCKC